MEIIGRHGNKNMVLMRNARRGRPELRYLTDQQLGEPVVLESMPAVPSGSPSRAGML